MTVKVMNRAYRMSRKEFTGLLQIASEQVPFGIYAVEKENYAELRRDKCSSMTQLKRMVREYQKQGLKVYKNG